MGRVIPFPQGGHGQAGVGRRRHASRFDGAGVATLDKHAVPDSTGWDAALDQWAGALRAAGRAPTTIRTRTDHVRRAGRALGVPPWSVTAAQLADYAGARAWSTETRRSVGASLRGFYRWGAAMGYTEHDPTTALPAIRPAPARPRPAPEAVYRQAVLSACPRVRMILRLAGEVGLRRAEIAQVHSRDLSRDLTGWSLLVHGKGNRERVVPLPDGIGAELAAQEPGWVFPTDYRGHDGHLSPRWVGKLAAKALPDSWTLHTLRHRFATQAYGLDRDLLVVQQLLGHSSPVITRRYVLVPDDRLRDTVRRVQGL